jgi:hypothetical protein
MEKGDLYLLVAKLYLSLSDGFEVLKQMLSSPVQLWAQHLESKYI